MSGGVREAAAVEVAAVSVFVSVPLIEVRQLRLQMFTLGSDHTR